MNFLIRLIETGAVMKILILFLSLVLFSGCGKKKPKPHPELEAMLNAQVTCVKCRRTAERREFRRVNSALVQCTICQKIFPVKKKK